MIGPAAFGVRFWELSAKQETKGGLNTTLMPPPSLLVFVIQNKIAVS